MTNQDVLKIEPISTSTKFNQTNEPGLPGLTTDVMPVVEMRCGRPMITSRNLALVFGKRHALVLRTIKGLRKIAESSIRGINRTAQNCAVPQNVKSHEFIKRNIRRSYYVNAQNKRQPQYILTRDGFTLLAMGFTGPRALQFKIAYINAFNEMERKLAERTLPKSHPKQTPVRSQQPSLKDSIKSRLDLLLPLSQFMDGAQTDEGRFELMNQAIRMATLAYKLGPNAFRPARQ